MKKFRLWLDSIVDQVIMLLLFPVVIVFGRIEEQEQQESDGYYE